MTERSTTAFTLAKGATKSAVEPPTFRFSGLGIIVHRITLTSVTCIAASIRTSMNVDERIRMRPKTRPPGLGCLAETFARAWCVPTRHTV
jgi:hypothetical protein